jgi:hypothetical protein
MAFKDAIVLESDEEVGFPGEILASNAARILVKH